MSVLKLIALDPEDLAVISAQLQDAVARVEDLAFLPADQKFAGVFNRFNWLEAQKAGGGRSGLWRKNTFERRQSALRFDRVTGARHQGLDLTDKRRVLSLLALQFEPAGEGVPDGTITLTFSGGSAIALDVECIECELRDMGAAWSTGSKPRHDADDQEI